MRVGRGGSQVEQKDHEEAIGEVADFANQQEAREQLALPGGLAVQLVHPLRTLEQQFDQAESGLAQHFQIFTFPDSHGPDHAKIWPIELSLENIALHEDAPCRSGYGELKQAESVKQLGTDGADQNQPEDGHSAAGGFKA